MIDPTNQLSLSAESLKALADSSAAINSTLDLRIVLDEIARNAAAVAKAEAGSVIIFDRRRMKLVFAAAFGEQGTTLVGKDFDAELGIAGRVVRTGKAEIVRDVAAHPSFFAGFDQRGSFQTRELMVAPMVYQSQVIGVIEVLNRVGGGHFEPADLGLLKVFANLAACSAHHARSHEDLKKENLGLRETVLGETQIIGTSAAMQEMLDLADRVARTNATALLQGETGTGKELLAKYIHKASERRDRAFVGVNCAALSETLLESELFGHEKGAFTGASSQRMGRFELADHGTLFLDEIGDLRASTQVKLLRVLQEREFMRVGGTRLISCDVRIIAATNRNLQQAIEEGKFRNELYYRLNVFPIHLPPLRERREDISLLMSHFARQTSVELGVATRRFNDQAAALLIAHAWPGNVRELANVVERAVLMADSDEIGPAHLPSDIAGSSAIADATGDSSLWGYERAMIVKALGQSSWNQTKAAKTLGISRDNLRYRVKKYNIVRPSP